MTGPSPVPFVPREYLQGAVTWYSKAARDLGRSLHPILDQATWEEVSDLPGELPDHPRVEAFPAAEGQVDFVRDGVPGELVELSSPLYRPMVTEQHLTVSLEEVLNFDVDAFLLGLVEFADDLGGQLVRGMIDHISDLCDANGQVVDASGRDIFDTMNDALETLDIEFDQDGNHNLTLAMHPDQYKLLSGRTPTPEQEQRREEILERRRGESRASSRRTELP